MLSSSIFTDSSPSHSSVTSHSPPLAFTNDDDEFSDFMQGPVDASSSFPSSSSLFPPSSQVHPQSLDPGPSQRPSFPHSSQAHPQSLDPGPGQRPSSSSQSLPASVSIPTATQHSTGNSSSQSAFQGNSFFVCINLISQCSVFIINL